MSNLIALVLAGACLALSVNSYEVADCHVCPQPTAQHPYNPTSRVHGQESGCEKFGRHFNEGERHHKNHLWYLCENGFMHCAGCYYDESKDLNVGESYIDYKTNTSFKCYGHDNTIAYRELTCGALGFNSDLTACNTAYVPTSADKLNLGCEEKACQPTYTKPSYTATYTHVPAPQAPAPAHPSGYAGSVPSEPSGYSAPVVPAHPAAPAPPTLQVPTSYPRPVPSTYEKKGGYQLENGGYEQGQTQTGGSVHGGYQQGSYTPQKTYTPVKTPQRCTKNGQFFTEGEIYRNNHLWYKCVNGIMVVKGCYTSNDKDLLPGQNYVDHEAKSILTCQQTGTKIGYNLKYCTGTGFNSALTDCKGTTQDSGHTYNEVAHHKVYVTKNEVGQHIIDEEKQMHVDCNCGPSHTTTTTTNHNVNNVNSNPY